MNEGHVPVLLKEVIEYLNPQTNQNFIDLTAGGGGHAAAILEQTGPRGVLVGVEWDKRTSEIARKRLTKYQDRVIFVSDNFKNINKIKNERFPSLPIRGILLDLGLSSYSLADANRGFSFQDNGELDMRFNPEGGGLTAADILNTYSFEKLSQIFREYGEDRFYNLIAAKVIQSRVHQKYTKTKQLVSAVLQVYKEKLRSAKEVPYLKSGLHPATKIFQALRIAVNDEMGNLETVLPEALTLLEKGGRLAVISFHSLEDRIVKNFFRTETRDCLCPPEIPVCQCHHKKSIKILTKKPVRPSFQELKSNPRSRSAKMRVAEKIFIN
ncbi:MAG: 16S rRNA (cytosine(1402)-N(4))-methyltransferase RsmH [Patescibacteria group bacterium]